MLMTVLLTDSQGNQIGKEEVPSVPEIGDEIVLRDGRCGTVKSKRWYFGLELPGERSANTVVGITVELM